MSEHREQFVALDLGEAVGGNIPRLVERWLRERGWIGETCARDFLYKRATTYLLGPSGLARGVPPDRWNVISVDPGPDLWLGRADDSGPVCPRCDHDEGAEIDAELATSWFEAREEPVHRCPRCGFEDLLGNWDLTDASAFGSAAVVLEGDRAYENKDVLLGELRSGFGGRWAYVHLHL